jgi:hypothetical protein
MSPLFRPNDSTALSTSFRPVSPRRPAVPVALTGLSLAALLALGGCGQEAASPTAQSPDAPSSSSPDSPDTAGKSAAGTPTDGVSEPTNGTAATPSAPDPTSLTEDQMTDLLLLHAQLKTDLGASYSDAWIEDGQLHVAVTTPEAEAVVSGAGAIPAKTEFSDQQLREAADAFKAWLGTDAAPQVQLHWLATSGRTGSINVRVPAEQVQPLNDAVAQQQPTGAVKVIVEESSGPATPLGTNAP